MNRLLKKEFIQWLLCWLVNKYCLFSFYTSKVEFENRDIFFQLHRNKTPIIISFWHGRLLFIPFLADKKQLKDCYTIVSLYGSGVFIAKAISMFGGGLIRGSTNSINKPGTAIKNRGGWRVLKESIGLLKLGKIVAYTPDGPHGPKMRINETGMLKIASLTSATILPVTASSSNATIFNSWDSFMLPHPFGRIKIIVGMPIVVPENADNKTIENARKDLEDRLNVLSELVDRHVCI